MTTENIARRLPNREATPTRYHVESRYSNLEYKAQLALRELHDFWTELYGPNEALTGAFECLDALRETFDATDDDAGGITAEGTALGHRYVMGNVNCYCPKCSKEYSEREGRDICVLDCDYDMDK